MSISVYADLYLVHNHFPANLHYQPRQPFATLLAGVKKRKKKSQYQM